ncbi:hypothetical protein, partial [Mycobacterium tuberculosis]|uniref:hypothetical protein n=1 Tax=Mycobacterium tuberculosis TaxID=1773 RepID=UPI001BE0F305
SLMFNKVIMACIENHEPLLVIANEQSVQEFRQMLLVTAMGTGTRKTIKRQIRRVIVDTGKPSEGSGEMPRWERFTEDMKELYKLARKNGGGLDLALWVNTQLADSAIKQRFLNEYALGESKKAKNEASVLFL